MAIWSRELMALVSHEHFKASYPQIARAAGKVGPYTGKPTHSTFVEAKNRAIRRLAIDDDFRDMYNNVCRSLGETPMKFEE